MEGLNPELLRQRMMRGALTGPAESDKAPPKYCAGKLDNGRPCRIVVLNDEDYCSRHKKEIEALEAGAPLPPKRSERTAQETTMKNKKLKHTYCSAKGCYRIVKKEGEFCKVHQGLQDQVEAGVSEGEMATKVAPPAWAKNAESLVTEQNAEHLAAQEQETVADPAPQHELVEIEATSICAVCVGDCNAGPTPCYPGSLTECINFVQWTRNDERTAAMLTLVGYPTSLELLAQQSDQDVMASEFYAGAMHLQASDNDDVPIPPMPLFLKGSQTAISTSSTFGDDTENLSHAPSAATTDHLADAGKLTEREISPVAPAAPHGQPEPCAVLSSPLAAVLVELQPPPPPLPETSVVIDFAPDMFETLVDKGVGTETIIELLHVLFISQEYRLVRHAAA